MFDSGDIMKEIIDVINNDGIVIMPTDTIYGIVAKATNEDVVKKVYSLKRRDDRKPMLILVSDKEMLNDYVSSINELEKTLIDNFWPGPLTIIFDKKNISDLLTGGLSTIGIRIPDNKEMLDIISCVGVPLLSTSVNLSGEKSATCVSNINDTMLNNVDFVYDNGECNDVPSTIIRVLNGEVKILREGIISKEKIESVINRK